MELSIIIVNYNVRRLLLDCVRSVINGAKEIDYEIIVVDNASSDGSVEDLKGAFSQIPQIRVIANSENVGFARANNQGYEITRGDFILLLNPDTVVRPGAIKSTLEFLKSTHDAGIAGGRLFCSDGTLQKSIGVFPSVGNHMLRTVFLDRLLCPAYRRKAYYRERPFRVDYCMGAFMMVRKEALGNMPLLSPEFFMYAEEKDLALRLLKRDWYTYFVPSAEAVHYKEQSTRQMAKEMFAELQKSQVIFFRRHYSGAYRNGLVWTYWFFLCSSFLASIFWSSTARGRLRLRLFAHAVAIYPRIVVELAKGA